MFTVEQRDALCERILDLGEQDERVDAGAVVGSLAFDEGDRFSDVDLTFGVADHVEVTDVLDDWTRTLVDEFDAVPLVDLDRGPITYRVFLLPEALQLDLSMSPAAAVPSSRAAVPARVRRDGCGWARGVRARRSLVTSSSLRRRSLRTSSGGASSTRVHARACIERGRMWQAEHYVGAVRDHALALACLREGSPAAQARSYDDLSAETLARFEGTHVGALGPRSAPRSARRLRARAHARGRGSTCPARRRRRRTPRRHPGRPDGVPPPD